MLYDSQDSLPKRHHDRRGFPPHCPSWIPVLGPPGSSWSLDLYPMWDTHQGPECSWLVPLQEACCAYVLMVTAVYWVSEAVPLGAAALVPAFLYPLFGVLKSSEVSVEVTSSGSPRTERIFRRKGDISNL